ncbi:MULTISPECIES: sensor histidine kinase [unclassified Luteococcus]|uniref:sensor histidine kinase n=1 Tax=unclassified Luteococcus TaxID=2639923 RepID=UPI00313B992E
MDMGMVRASLAGTALGCASAMAVGRGSLWWFAVPVALAVLVLATEHRRWRRGTVAAAVAGLPVAAGLGALAYPQHAAGAINSTLVAAALLMVGASVVGWRAALHYQREEGRRAQELLRVEQERRSAQIREALVDQRVRLAEELHDGIGHRLNHAVLRLGALGMRLDDEQTADEVSRVRSDLAAILDSVGDLVTLLEPDESRPPLAIEQVLQSARVAGTQVDWEGNQLEEAGPGQRALVAGVLAEALANAGRHAPGEPVRVVVRQEAEQFGLHISNRITAGGRPGAGTGLRRTRQRVEMAGGRLEVTEDELFVLELILPRQVPVEVGVR